MSNQRELWSMAAALSLCFVARAGGEPPEDPRRIAPPKRIPDIIEQPLLPGQAVSTASMPRDVRRAVVADAAKRFQVAENAVVLAQAERVTWSDGSLGCPQPGMMYTQAIVPGYRVELEAAGKRLVYHASTKGSFKQCDSKLRQMPVPDPSRQ